MTELKELRPEKPVSLADELKSLRVCERIDAILNIIDRMPLRGYQQWNPASEAMKALAALGNDFGKFEQKFKAEGEVENTETE